MLRIDINLIFTVINVLVLCAAVRIFLWKPIHKILDERQAQADSMLTDAAKAKIIDEAYDPIYGARPLRRYLQHTVETLISRKIIADQVEPDAVLTVDVDNDQLVVR